MDSVVHGSTEETFSDLMAKCSPHTSGATSSHQLSKPPHDQRVHGLPQDLKGQMRRVLTRQPLPEPSCRSKLTEPIRCVRLTPVGRYSVAWCAIRQKDPGVTHCGTGTPAMLRAAWRSLVAPHREPANAGQDDHECGAR
jgi:hypothetical protein